MAALSIEPGLIGANYNLGVALEQLGRGGALAGAEQLLERVRLECARVREALEDLEQAA